MRQAALKRWWQHCVTILDASGTEERSAEKCLDGSNVAATTGRGASGHCAPPTAAKLPFPPLLPPRTTPSPALSDCRARRL